MSIVSVRVGTPSGGAHLVQILKGIYITLIRLRHAYIPNRGAKKSSHGLANIPGQIMTKITGNKTIGKIKPEYVDPHTLLIFERRSSMWIYEEKAAGGAHKGSISQQLDTPCQTSV